MSKANSKNRDGNVAVPVVVLNMNKAKIIVKNMNMNKAKVTEY